MQLQHDLVRNNLNIVLWKLRYPIIFTNNTPIQLLINLRLLIISDLSISLDDFFVKDVVRSMNINITEVYALTEHQLNTLILPLNFLNYCWWVGIKALYNFHCMNLITPSLIKLKYNINAKRDLWKQINYFVYSSR